MNRDADGITEILENFFKSSKVKLVGRAMARHNIGLPDFIQ
jgi:hypothetical protein